MRQPRRISNGILLTISVIIGYMIGTGIGSILDVYWTKRTLRKLTYFRFPMQLCNAAILSLEAPFLVSIVVSAVGSMDIKLLRQVLLITIGLSIGLSYIAIWVGILMAISIRPGVGITLAPIGSSQIIPPRQVARFDLPLLVQDSFWNILLNMFPDNLIEATLIRKMYKLSRDFSKENEKTYFESIPAENYTIANGRDPTWKLDQINRLGLSVVAIAIGVAIRHLGPYGRPLLAFSHSFADAANQIAIWTAWLIPLASLFHALNKFVSGDHTFYNSQVLAFCGITTVTAIMILTAVIIPAIYMSMTKKIPKKLILKTLPSLAAAFGTGSSVLAFPITLHGLDEADINPRISRIVFPIALLCNISGNMVHVAVSSIFIKQLRNQILSIKDYIFVSLITPIATMEWHETANNNNNNENKIAVMLGVGDIRVILPYIGVHDPTSAIKVLPLEWIVDPFRELLNSFTAIFIAGLVHHILRNKLKDLPYFEDVLEEEVIRQRLKMWSGKEKELEETIAEEAEGYEDEDYDSDGPHSGELPPQDPFLDSMNEVTESATSVETKSVGSAVSKRSSKHMISLKKKIKVEPDASGSHPT